MTSDKHLLMAGKMADEQVIRRTTALGAAGFFLVFALLISAASYVLILNNTAIDKANTQENLTSIGHLKTEQIQAYFDERKRDGLNFAKLLARAKTQRWLANPSAGVPEGLRETLDTVQAVIQYGGVLVLDDHARVRFGSGLFQRLSEQSQSLALSALHKKSMQVSSIYFGDPSAPGQPLLDIFVPIVDPATASVIGVLLLRDDLQGFFAQLQSWPVKSRTAESLLVTRDGSDVLLLNEPRHQRHIALKLRVPLSGDAHTAIRAARGETGIVEGLDYRGKQVVAYIQPVPDTAWGLVVKIDQDEAMENVRRQQYVALLVTLLFIWLAGMMIRLWWSRHEIEWLAHQQFKRAADTLRESEERFRQVVENIDEVFWVSNVTKDHCLYVSPSYLAVFGEPCESLYAFPQSWLALVHPEDRERVQLAATTKQAAGSYDEEYRIIRPDGTVRWILDRAFPVLNEAGEVYRIVGVAKDITIRKTAELKIQWLTQLYVVLNQCKETIMHCTNADELFTKVCRDVVELGAVKMAWVGLVEQQQIRPVASWGEGREYLEDIRISTDAGDEFGRGPIGIALRENRPYWCQDFQHDHATAAWHERGARFGWGALAALPLRQNGVAIGTITVYAGKANILGEVTRNLLVEMAMDISFALDKFALDAVRVRAEEARDKALVELEQANAHIEEERARLAERVMERTAQLIYANRAKDSFLATMSHEIRTPLGGLLGMMELLSRSRLDAEQHEMLRAARGSGKNLLRIVDDILDWTKIEAGKLVLSPQTVSIPAMLRGVVSTYAQLSSEKGIQLRWQVDTKLSAAHLFDPLRVSQILNNFTSNAIKFTEQGSVEISAELLARQDGHEQVRFRVKDSGIGIDKVQQERLFQHYEQASADTARMYGGTGLGLSICRKLADLMDGTISVDSTPGRGATFCFTISLPVASPAAQRDLQLQQAGAKRSYEKDIRPLADAGQVSVLAVDDQPVNRMLLKLQLALLGVHAEVAASGSEALSLWRNRHFDLIITDCHMPEMDGYELARSIRDMGLHDARPRVAIIAWTANVLAEEEERCLAAGIDDMLTKPTDLSDLRAMLLKWLIKAGIAVSLPEAPTPEAPTIAAAQHPSVADAAVDFGILEKIAKSHAGQVEMLQEFLLHNRNDIANLNAALKDGNPAAVARCAHRIKGACRMVGALKLADICAAIEQAAKQGDMDGARRETKTALGEVVEQLEQAISRFIGEQHAS
ncbi:MAG: putative Histidine kinase [Candidatus Gallionella acididurans]|uniref:Virulence sensor protein BvgS n=1 Tax=Candidatus Gallionella acididurans TaxID=1796491 RepID=A0A139BXN9_9PROT|nr:MAG: putative Histidine kinase [Candidatus Gallionella acididurans]